MRVRSFLTTLFQVSVLSLASYLCDRVATWIHSPLPGSILGFGLLFLLLMFRVVRIEWFEQAAKLLHGEMLLFFVPSAVGILQFGHLVQVDGWKLLVLVVLGTLLVMTFTGLATDRLMAEVPSRRSAS